MGAIDDDDMEYEPQKPVRKERKLKIQAVPGGPSSLGIFKFRTVSLSAASKLVPQPFPTRKEVHPLVHRPAIAFSLLFSCISCLFSSGILFA